MEKYFRKLYKGQYDEFVNELRSAIKMEEKRFVITANPETFMMSEKDKEKMLNRFKGYIYRL